MGSQAAGPPDRGLEINGFPRGIAIPTERDRLIAAMAATCAERGYAATSIEEVVARAGVPRRAFEQSFADKADCGVAAANQILAEITAVSTAAYSVDAPEWEIILRAVRALLELLAARPSFAYLGCIEARHSMPREAYEVYTAAIRVLLAMLDRLRAYAAADAQQPPSATRGGLGGAEALIRRELRAGRAESLPELLPDIVYGLLVPFLDQQEALHYTGLARELLNEGG